MADNNVVSGSELLQIFNSRFQTGLIDLKHQIENYFNLMLKHFRPPSRLPNPKQLFSGG